MRRRSLMKLTAPALAIGLALSGQGDAEAASPNANINGIVNSNAQVSQSNGASLDHRLSPVENKLQSVQLEANFIASQLEDAESLTPEQYEYYKGEIDSLLNRANASTNQLNAVSNKFGNDASGIIEVEGDINLTISLILDLEDLLEGIEIVPEEPVEEAPDEETPEEPVEEVPDEETPEEPVEEAPDEEAPEEPVEEAPDEEAPEEPVEEAPDEETPDEPVEVRSTRRTSRRGAG
ncbi:hypothetical protein [Salinicoccus roseus]|nr:hypothetical protein [Salinicoccus roseus]MDB0579436.1 hypothetical protein [Salinicoccus roseus]